MKKFIIKTLGCKVNQYDSLTLRQKLIEKGFEHSQENSGDVDLAIVNSCAVTKNAVRKGRRMLALVRKENPNAKLVLLGCWPKIYPEEMTSTNADLIWEVGNLAGLVQEIGKMLGDNKKNGRIEKKDNTGIHPPGQGERSRYFMKIQDGCEQFCSYCIIPYSRGALSSRPKEEILEEIEAVIQAGYDEIILCGIHLGLYGKEKNATTCDLKSLLKEVLKIENLGRIRLSSIEVNDVDDELLELMAENEKLCRHLHFPLQAGTDKILKAMNRPYTTEYFRERVAKARELMPNLALTTDVIVGFPGETDADFEETMSFCKEMKFSRMHVFPFSAHEKTPAAAMDGQISKEIKKKRAKQLREIGEMLEKAYNESFVGEKLKVIIERIGEDIWGKSEFYFDVISKKDSLKNLESLKNGKLFELTKER